MVDFNPKKAADFEPDEFVDFVPDTVDFEPKQEVDAVTGASPIQDFDVELAASDKPWGQQLEDSLKIGGLRLGRAVVEAPKNFPSDLVEKTKGVGAVLPMLAPIGNLLRIIQKSPQVQEMTIGDKFQDIINSHPEWRGEPPESIKDLITHPKKLMAAIAESAPTMIAAGIATAAGAPSVALGIMYAVEGQDAKDQAIKDGATPEQAQDVYELYGTVAAALEFLQVKQTLKILSGTKDLIVKRTVQKLAQKGGKTFGRVLIENAAKEAIEEVAQGRWQEITAKIVYDKPLPAPAEMIDRALQEALITTVATLGTGLPGISIQTAQTFQQQVEQSKAETAAKALTPKRLAEITSGQGAIPSTTELRQALGRGPNIPLFESEKIKRQLAEELESGAKLVSQEQGQRAFTPKEGADIGAPPVTPRIALPPQPEQDELSRQVPELAEVHVRTADKIVGGELVKGFEGTATGEIIFIDGQEQAVIVDSLGEKHAVPINEVEHRVGDVVAADEVVTAAALRNSTTGEIHEGITHAEAFETVDQNLVRIDDLESGFITDKGRFISANEAQEISLRSKQISKGLDTALKEEGLTLAAEDINLQPTEARKSQKKELNALKSQVHKTQREMKIGAEQYSKIAMETTRKRSAADMTKDELTDFNNALKATDPAVNFVTQSRITESQDTGSLIVSQDSNINKEQKTDRVRQIRNVRRTNKRIKDNEARGRETSLIDNFAPKRLAVAKFEDKTSVPVTYLDHQTTKKAKIRGHTAKEEFGRLLAGMEHNTQLSPKNNKAVLKGIERLIQTTSRESNEQIANWLFSEDTRTEVEPLMSEKDIATANTLEHILQDTIVASERMQESLRLWVDRGKAPSDISKFDKVQQKDIFDQAKVAQQAGRLGEYTQQLFDNDVRFGLRRYYYPAETEHTNTVLDMLKNAAADPIETFSLSEAEIPSLIGGETRARKGVGKPRKGSVFSNIMSSYERVAVRNAVAEDIKELYNRYNSVPLSATDKKYLDAVYGEMLLKGELTTPPHNIIQKLHSTFWRTHLSLVTNFLGAMKATIRNSLQFLEAGGAVNTRAMTATGFSMVNQLVQGKTLADIDPQMAEDFHRSFGSYISQRGSQYKDAMFRDIDAKAKADNLPEQAVDMAKWILDITGFAYVGVDTVSRASLWPTVYKTTKDAATKYVNGEMTYKKYLDVTNVDTMMSPSQTRAARELLSAGDIRGLSNYVADIYTFDVFRAYATTERAGIERTREQRTITGIYTYPRGVFDLFYSRGLRPLFSKDSTVSQRRRGAFNVANGLLGRSVANTALVGLGLGSMYALGRTFYTPLSPALNIAVDATGRISLVLFRHSNGDLDNEESIVAISKILYDAADGIVHALPDRKKKKPAIKKQTGRRSSRGEPSGRR